MRQSQRACGFNLIELMVALAIGCILLGAFLTAFTNSRRLSAANESVASLHDTARHAWSVLAADIEHAGFYGFAINPARIRLVRGASMLAAPGALRQTIEASAAPPVAGLPAGAHACGNNFAVDVELWAEGSNNSAPSGMRSRTCAPTASAGGIRPGTDTLTLRHAALTVSAPRAGRIQLYTRRLGVQGAQDLFADGASPGAVGADHEVRDLEVHTYYIANNSVERPGWPALRVKQLTESRGAAQFRDEEILPGVEDLQVEFGIVSGEGSVRQLQYVAADFPGLRDSRVQAVRIWLRICADLTEPGYREAGPMNYADVSFTPDASSAVQRRAVFERTIAIRMAESP